MRYRSSARVAAILLFALALAGCGAARKLTTRHRTFTYTTSLPPAPANAMAHGQYTLDEEVRNTYHKYHGGVDWTRFAYEARNSSTVQGATLRLYVSLADNLTAGQLAEQATLVETIELMPGEQRTITLTEAPRNEPMRAFLENALSRSEVTTIHFYAATASSDPLAIISVEPFTTEVRVHGSYF